ncbi:MAG: hypothetical protein AAGF24_02635 [Cyanobacteria bacterium P01_H01_bin.121]
MSSNAKRSNRTVTFTQTDQALVTAIDELLAAEAPRYSSFSELAKQALRQFLLTSEPQQALTLFVQLQKQVVALELKLASLETEQLNAVQQRLTGLEGNLQDVQEQLLNLPATTAETNHNHTEPEATPPADPLLNRLSNLLEDF